MTAQMSLKERVEELERRVRELEARPVYVPYPIVVPSVPSIPWWQQPTTIPGQWYVSLGSLSGNATVTTSDDRC